MLKTQLQHTNPVNTNAVHICAYMFLCVQVHIQIYMYACGNQEVALDFVPWELAMFSGTGSLTFGACQLD